MSFEKLDLKDTSTDSTSRSCIIICNFKGKELNLIKSYSKIIGISDCIIVSYKNGESKIQDIIDNNTLATDSNGSKEKSVIFNNISNAKLNLFIENLKKLRINNTLIATVTETSKNWTLDTLIKNLQAERIALKSGKNIEHN